MAKLGGQTIQKKMNETSANSTNNVTMSQKEEQKETKHESFKNKDMDESLHQSLQDFKFDVECLQREKHLELKHERHENMLSLIERLKKRNMENEGLLSPRSRISRTSLLSPRFKSPLQDHRRRSDILKSTLLALDPPLLSPQKDKPSVSGQTQQQENNSDTIKHDPHEEHEKSLDRQFRRQVKIEDLKGTYRRLSLRRIEAEAEADRTAAANKALGEESSDDLSDVEPEEQDEHEERQSQFETSRHSYTALRLTMEELEKLHDASPGILAENDDSLHSSLRVLEEKRSEYAADLLDYGNS